MNTSGINGIIKATVLISFFGLLSRVFGLFRDRILAQEFGASEVLDAYYISFGIPDLIFNLIVAGSLSVAIIPKFIEIKAQSSSKAFDLANRFLGNALLVIAIFAFLVIIFAPQLVNLIAPGLSLAGRSLAEQNIRIMIFSPLIMSISLIIGSVLQAHKRFISYALAPVFYNVGIIIGAVFFVPVFGPLGLAEGVVLGAILHLVIQLPEAYSAGYRFKPLLGYSKDIGEIVSLMIPRSVGLAAQQSSWVFVNGVLTLISAGSVAVFNFAYNLQYLPIALIGVSLGIASFPDMSELALLADKQKFRATLSKHLLLVLALTTVTSFVLYYYADLVVRIVLGVGMFGGLDVIQTSLALKGFLIGVPALAMIQLLARGYYSLKNSLTPAIASIISVLVTVAFILLSNMVINPQNVALILSLSAWINVIILISLLSTKVTRRS